jgi:hypothetical protein
MKVHLILWNQTVLIFHIVTMGTVPVVIYVLLLPYPKNLRDSFVCTDSQELQERGIYQLSKRIPPLQKSLILSGGMNFCISEGNGV